MSIVVGIDLGCAHVSAVLFEDGVLKNRVTFPAVVCIREDGSVLCGEEAETAALEFPYFVFAGPLRFLGRSPDEGMIKRCKSLMPFDIESSPYALRQSLLQSSLSAVGSNIVGIAGSVSSGILKGRSSAEPLLVTSAESSAAAAGSDRKSSPCVIKSDPCPEQDGVWLKAGWICISPLQLTAYLLRAAVDRLTDKTAVTAESFFISVSDSFPHRIRRLIKDAAFVAGLKNVSVVRESTAIVCSAVSRDLLRSLTDQKGRPSLLFSLSSTCCNAVILSSDGSEVISSAGKSRLGGEDFTLQLMQFVSEEFKYKSGIDLLRHKESLHRLHKACEEVKIAIDGAETAFIQLPYLCTEGDRHIHLDMSVEKRVMEQHFALLSDKAADCALKATEAAGLKAQSIGRIVLYGKTACSPAVRNKLRTLFKDADFVTDAEIFGDNVRFVCAEGAALKKLLSSGHAAGNKRFVLTECLPYALALASESGTMRTLIPAGTPLPAEVSAVYPAVLRGRQSRVMSVFDRIGKGLNKDSGQFSLSYSLFKDSALIRSCDISVFELDPADRSIVYPLGSLSLLSQCTADPETENGELSSRNVKVTLRLSADETGEIRAEAFFEGEKPSGFVNAVQQVLKNDTLDRMRLDLLRHAVSAAGDCSLPLPLSETKDMMIDSKSSSEFAAESKLTAFADVSEVKELKEKLSRALNELERVRKAAAGEIKRNSLYAGEKFTEGMIPVFDALEKAVEYTAKLSERAAVNDPVRNIHKGEHYILNLLLKSLESLGVRCEDPTGQTFNPAFHQALSTEDDPACKPGNVVKTVQKGFILHDRTVRPARVVVCRRGADTAVSKAEDRNSLAEEMKRRDLMQKSLRQPQCEQINRAAEAAAEIRVQKMPDRPPVLRTTAEAVKSREIRMPKAAYDTANTQEKAFKAVSDSFEQTASLNSGFDSPGKNSGALYPADSLRGNLKSAPQRARHDKADESKAVQEAVSAPFAAEAQNNGSKVASESEDSEKPVQSYSVKEEQLAWPHVPARQHRSEPALKAYASTAAFNRKGAGNSR